MANTFFNKSNEQKVTYFEIGHQAMEEVTPRSHAQLDVALVPNRMMQYCNDIVSIREESFKSHHYLVVSNWELKAPEYIAPKSKQRVDISSLDHSDIAHTFIAKLETEVDMNPALQATSQIDQKIECFTDLVHSIAQEELPKLTALPRKPWISARTLHYIDDRSKARTIRDYRLEASLNKLIKKSVKQDRKSWLHK